MIRHSQEDEGWRERLQPHQHAPGELILVWCCGDVLGERMDVSQRPLQRTAPVIRRPSLPRCRQCLQPLPHCA
jgi:hypothetical protein